MAARTSVVEVCLPSMMGQPAEWYEWPLARTNTVPVRAALEPFTGVLSPMGRCASASSRSRRIWSVFCSSIVVAARNPATTIRPSPSRPPETM